MKMCGRKYHRKYHRKGNRDTLLHYFKDHLKQTYILFFPIVLFFALSIASSYYFFNLKTVLVTENAGLFQAEIFARGKLYAPAPPQEVHDLIAKHPTCFLYRNNKWYGHNDPGQPLILSIGVIMGAPWLINPIMGLITLIVLFNLSKILVDERFAYIVVFIAPLSPLFVLIFSNHMGHAGTTLFLTLFLFYFLKVLKDKNYALSLFAGLFLGFAILCRPYDSLLYAFPIIIYGCFLLLRKRIDIKSIIYMGLPVTICILLLMMYYYFTNGNPVRSNYTLAPNLVGMLPGFGERGLIDETFVHTPLKAFQLFLVYINAINKNLIGHVYAAFFAIASYFISRSFLKFRHLILSIIISLLIGYSMFFWYDPNFGGARYLSSAVPLLLLFVAALIYKLWQLLSNTKIRIYMLSARERAHFDMRFLLPLYVVIVCLITPINISVALNGKRFNQDIIEYEILAQQFKLEKAVVFVPNGPTRRENGPFLDDRIIYARISDKEKMKKLSVYLNRENNAYIFDGSIFRHLKYLSQ